MPVLSKNTVNTLTHRGKTQTIRLSQEEAKLLAEWIANARQFDKIVTQMESVSLRITKRLLNKLQKA